MVGAETPRRPGVSKPAAALDRAEDTTAPSVAVGSPPGCGCGAGRSGRGSVLSWRGRRQVFWFEACSPCLATVACTDSLQLLSLPEGGFAPQGQMGEETVLRDAVGVRRCDARQSDFGSQPPSTVTEGLQQPSQPRLPGIGLVFSVCPCMDTLCPSLCSTAESRALPWPSGFRLVQPVGSSAWRARGERGWGFVTWLPSCEVRLHSPREGHSSCQAALSQHLCPQGMPSRCDCSPLLLVSGCFTVP